MAQATEVKRKAVKGVTILEIIGDLDVTSLPILQNVMWEAQQEGHNTMVLDLSATKYVTSTAVGLIVKRWKDLKDGGGNLKLCGVSAFIKKTLGMLGVEKIIELYETQEEAAESCAGGGGTV